MDDLDLERTESAGPQVILDLIALRLRTQIITWLRLLSSGPTYVEQL